MQRHYYWQRSESIEAGEIIDFWNYMGRPKKKRSHPSNIYLGSEEIKLGIAFGHSPIKEK